MTFVTKLPVSNLTPMSAPHAQASLRAAPAPSTHGPRRSRPVQANAYAAGMKAPKFKRAKHDIVSPLPLLKCRDKGAPSHLKMPTDEFPALLAYEPQAEATPSLKELGAAARPMVEEALEISGGAVMLRNLPIHSKKDFYEFGAGLGFPATPYLRLFLDRAVEDGVYDVTVNPDSFLLSPHNENVFYPRPTPKIMFCMHQPAEVGGESLVQRNSDFTRAVPQWVVDRFEENGGIRYDRWYPSAKQLESAPSFPGAPPMPSWKKFSDADGQAASDTPAHITATKYFTDLGLDVRWDGPNNSRSAGGAYTSDDDGLWASNVLPVLRPHGKNGENVWYNFADSDGIAPFFTITYGNGKPIEKEVKQAVKKARWEHTVGVPMRAGDVAIYDNKRCQHGRTVFSGARDMSVQMTS